MDSTPTLPRFDADSLTQLLPAVRARLLGKEPELWLPPAERYLVFVVDGLGEHALNDFADVARCISWMDGRAVTSTAPSTTATALSSLATGLAPGQHGLLGYQFRNPETSMLMNAVSFRGGPRVPERFQPQPTQFELVQSSVVAWERFHGTGLTRAILRGAVFRGICEDFDEAQWVQCCTTALAETSLVYAYYPGLDKAGHHHGVGSWQWLEELARVDDLADAFADALPKQSCLIVTGDHGMINTAPENHIVIERDLRLPTIDLVGGEGRFRHLYTPNPQSLLEECAAGLGERAWVLSGEQATHDGWFGHVNPGMQQRIGDVVVAMRGQWVLLTDGYAVEHRLIGVHGSLTEAEMMVPVRFAANG